jgi:hypothetical protein
VEKRREEKRRARARQEGDELSNTNPNIKMTSRGMEDKENVHVNMWHPQQDNGEGSKHEKKRVVFQCEEGGGEERPAASRPLASSRGSGADDDFNNYNSNGNHSTNVTPSNQTSEILQGKMRELREKLEKLKSKGRKSGTDGIDSSAGTAPSSPMIDENSSSEAPDRNPKGIHQRGLDLFSKRGLI